MLKLTMIAASMVLAVALAASAAPRNVGEVLVVKGQSFVEAGGKRTPLKVGDAVEIGDTIDVAVDAKLKLRMADGSVIAAAPGTRLTIEAYVVQPRDVRMELASGLLRAVVAKAGPSSRFEVATATGVAAVRSTDWFLSAERGATRVGVLDGVVSLTSNATQRVVEIPAGWGARIVPGQDLTPARPWSPAEFDDVIGKTNID